MDDEQEERGFTVSDRRFSSRRESEADRPRESPPPHSGILGEQGRAQGQPRSQDTEPPEEINFASFVISLGTQAFMHLGDIPNPVTQQREKDLGAVKQMIDLLGMLQSKTRGNLTADEERLLQQLLFDLRMRYVREAGR
jgi:hypothetical protein